MELYLFIFFLSLILSAFFSGIEIAFVSSNKLQIELEKNNGTWTGKKIAEFIQNPTRFINTILIGNNISLVLITWSVSMLFEQKLASVLANEVAILLILTLVTTIVILILASLCQRFFSEFMPIQY